jgi:hypothetical protein
LKGIRGPGPDYEIDPKYWVLVMAKFAFVLIYEVNSKKIILGLLWFFSVCLIVDEI